MSVIMPNLAEQVDREDILLAVEKIEKESITLNKIRKYYIEINGVKYPPKDLVRLAAQIKGVKYISEYKLKGGEQTNKYYRGMGFIVGTIGETYNFSLDITSFNKHFKDYVSYCKRSQWLRYREAYKFRFSRWLSSKIDFDKQNNDEILSICIDSQNQKYDVNSKVDGINFITSSLMYSDDFIVKKDIEALRKLYEGDDIEDIDFLGGATSFPKFSVWAGTLIPSKSRVYANEELTSGIAMLFNLKKYPKSGVKSFVLANECLNILADTVLNEYENEAYDLLSIVFPDNSTLSDSDLSWIVQDFILFLNRRVISKSINYFWVNQGSKYKQELNARCIVAPINNIHHHKRLKEMLEGDILLHYSGSEIKAKSVVVQEFEELPRPYENKLEDELVVKLNYEELVNPISIEWIQEKLSKHKNLLPKRYSPFDKNLKPYQSYCLNFNKSLFNLLLSDKTIEFKTKYTMKNPNIILYGPPGTGKTYSTINKALEIIDPDFLFANEKDRRKIVNRFNSLKESGQIVFTTFHQSMTYEDFIEGIKPKMVGDDFDGEPSLTYQIENGIFKEIAEKSQSVAARPIEGSSIYIPKEKFKNNINKISLGNSLNSEDDGIDEYCFENNCIALGFGEDIDFSGVTNRAEIREKFREAGITIESKKEFAVSAIERLVLWMVPGQLVFVSHGNSRLKAIGEISGDYYCDLKAPIRYSQFRKVKWLYIDLNIPILDVYEHKFSQQTIYQIDPRKINQEYFNVKSDNNAHKSLDYVFIIDEINRGNISQIFGELITLIEDDKRLGQENELKVVLPYSKEEFGIPSNLYIIGTMNTADRSIEALDTALRRRFSFIEMLPMPELIRKVGKLKETKGILNGIDIVNLLETINIRIEKLVDRDHMIGHSYFLKVATLEDLKIVFQNKVIPLLQEYFFGDYGKIGLIIGKAFFDEVSNDTNDNFFADFDYDASSLLEKPTYHLKNVVEMSDVDFKDALNLLLGKEDIEN